MIRCVLMDIEGTIISVAFVREVLFPYAKHRLAAFLREHQHVPALRQWTTACLDTVAQELGQRPADAEIPGILCRWIEEDRKHPGLKAIQGMIWHDGYRAGAFTPGLYEDVAPALKRWRRNGLRLALYSSGSEQAQRLLVEHTTDGDLTGLFSNFFDTSIGAKTETASYRHIGQVLALSSNDILFLSDIEAELDAAAEAGFNTTQIVRAGTNAGTAHPVCSNFGDMSQFDRSEPLSSTSERT
ncbi:MAG: acireductone synthase [Nitrospira sp.]|nr:MAG: acireductone synthase [Nitrospira sp.]